MSFTDEQFDRAFAEFQEFGPRRAIAIEKRWRDDHHDLDPDDFAALKTRCMEIERLAVELAGQVQENRLAANAAQRQLAGKYPYLTTERLSRLWSQAMYFAMK